MSKSLGSPFGERVVTEQQKQIDTQQKLAQYLRQIQQQNWNGVIPAALNGTKQGIVSGLESFLSGSTLSGYDWFDKKLNFGKSARQEEVQQLAESNNLGSIYTLANGAAEIGGGMKGLAAKTWNLGATGMKALPFIKESSNLAPIIGGAGLSSLTENSFKYDFSDLQKIGLGTLKGTAASVALIALQNGAFDVIKKFFPEANLAGFKGGIDNVLQDEKALSTVQKGIHASPALAQEVAQQIPAAAQRINQNTAELVNQNLKQRIDVPQTIANRQNQFDNYLQQHAADEVLDFAPRQQLDSIPNPSLFNVDNELSIEQAKKLIENLAKQNNLNIYGDINHFTNGSRRAYIKTLNSTLDKPNISYTQTHTNGNDQNYFVKKFIDKKTGNEFYDFIIERDGKLFNKYNTDKNYVLNQFKKPTKNLAFNGEYTKQPEALDALNGAYYNTKESLVNNDIFINGAIVNPNLPHISELYKNISPIQEKFLNKILDHTTKQSNAKAGSFESLQQAAAELDKIASSNHITNYMDSPQNAEIYDLKNKLINYLGETYKKESNKLEKIEPLKQAYQAGKQSEPLPQQSSQIEQNAYAQGQFDNMTSNSVNQNLAQNILQEPNIYNQLYHSTNQKLSQQNIAYNRSQLLEQQALNQSSIQRRPRNYIEWIKYYLEENAGRKALDTNFDGTNKWYSQQPEPYFANSFIQYEQRKK